MKEFLEIIKLLKDEEARCYRIGMWLKLSQMLLDTIRHQTRDYADALVKIINQWLHQNYDTRTHGPPTWKMLADAVGAPTGGNNACLADKIARLHPAIGQQS